MATPHIAAEKGDFAKVVLMPGDPLRATWIAENFLKDAKLVNKTRGALAYTGYTANGSKVSVMASGMGCPSMGIYSHELFSQFDVDAIIRIGTMGSFQENVKLRDIVVASAASADAPVAGVPGVYSAGADFELVTYLANGAKKHNLNLHVGNVLSSNLFYGFEPDSWKRWANLGVLGVEMESYMLYLNAAHNRKAAACICTISDSVIAPEILSSQERQEGLVDMINVALASVDELVAAKGWEKR